MAVIEMSTQQQADNKMASGSGSEQDTGYQ
jgi:hypothetical protein